MDRGMPNDFIFFTIHGSAIKSFVMTDLLVGTILYYVVKFMSHNEWISIMSCFTGTEVYKRVMIAGKKKFNSRS